jgi:2-hydroxychromene-2-carboxylate isomerase
VTDTRPHVELYYSYRSPYSYLAIGRLKRWAEAERVRIALRPVLPLAVRDPAFFDRANPLFVSYLMRDTRRVAEYLGVPFRWPRPDPVVMQLEPRCIPAEQPYIHRLTRLGVAAEQRGRGLDFTYQAGTMMWDGTVEGWHQGEHLAGACTRAGLDLAEMDAAIAAEPQTYIDIIAANQQAHREAGHWGVPTMVFEGQPFFGQDRIDLLQGRVGQSRAGDSG